MPWREPCNSTSSILARLGWFLNTRLKGEVDTIVRLTGLSSATVRRYMVHCPDKLAGGEGAQRLPVLLRILDAVEVNPAKLVCALVYGMDRRTFWRIIDARLCAKTCVNLRPGPQGPVQVEIPMMRLDDIVQPPPVEGRGPSQRWESAERMQTTLARYLGEQMHGRVRSLAAVAGMAATTLRRYSNPNLQAHGGVGPQDLRNFCTILGVLEINPARLMIAVYYGGDEATFRMLMNAALYLEDTASYRDCQHSGDHTNLIELGEARIEPPTRPAR